MAMRDDGWYPSEEGQDRREAEDEEARVYRILRAALSSHPADELRGNLLPTRTPALTFATYRRIVAHMTARDGFTQGAVVVPARFAPQLIMQTTSAGFRAMGQRTPRVAPPMVRVTISTPTRQAQTTGEE